MGKKTITIPMNVVGNKRVFGFRLRNIIEGIILAVLAIAIISPIPFVPRIKIIFDFIFGITFFGLSCIGIKDKSPSELIIDTYKYITSPKSWSLRSIKYGTKKSSSTNVKTSVTTEQSIAEKAFYLAKDKFTAIKEEGKIPFIGSK